MRKCNLKSKISAYYINWFLALSNLNKLKDFCFLIKLKEFGHNKVIRGNVVNRGKVVGVIP